MKEGWTDYERQVSFYMCGKAQTDSLTLVHVCHLAVYSEDPQVAIDVASRSD